MFQKFQMALWRLATELAQNHGAIMDRSVLLPQYSKPGTKAILYIFGIVWLIFYRIPRQVPICTGKRFPKIL